jgi:hypothetical protein
MNFAAAWHWLTTSRHERELEETNAVLELELDALRKDYRRLENSLLSGAGVAPLPEFEEVKAKPVKRIRRLSLHQKQRMFALETMPKKEEAS